jgi:hypothetical protein
MVIATEPSLSVKRSVSVRGDLDEQISHRTGGRGYSAYVNRALETQLRQDLLDEYLAVAVAEHGPVSDEVMDQVLADLEAAKHRR